MPNDQSTKQKNYNITCTKDKHFFASFLNLAFNNKKHIEKLYHDKFGKEIIKDFNDKMAISEKEQKIKFLSEYFPAASYLDNLVLKCKSSQKDYSFEEKLELFFGALDKLRNYYTHYYRKPIKLEDIDQNFIKLLELLFIKVVEDVKNFRTKHDGTTFLLKASLQQELDRLDNKDKENKILENAFQKFYKDKKIQTNYVIKAEDTCNVPLTTSGLLFFLSLFLHKRDNELLRANVFGFKAKIIENNPNSVEFMATHWVFNYLSVKPFKRKLTTAYQKEKLLMQIVDELSKVPNEVYETLTNTQKQEFIVGFNAFNANAVNYLTDEYDTVIRKRYQDKFNYFVLRYLDEFLDFSTIRFQIYLGNYVKDVKEKTIDGLTYNVNRVIKEKINVFGKLSELTNKKTDYFTTEKNITQTGLEIFPNPSYNIIANNIPIYIDINEIKGIGFKDNEKKDINNNKKLKIKEEIKIKLDANIILDPPTAYLSLNELQALLYELLCNETNLSKKDLTKKIKRKIINKLVNRYKTIENFDSNKKEPNQLKVTKKLRKSSDTTVINYPKLIRAIEKEITITEEKKELINKKTQEKKKLINKKNKKKSKIYIFTTKELGQEATWLANDIKRFMEIEKRKNWRSYHHNQLQKSLAFYDNNEQNLYKIPSNLWESNNDLFKKIEQCFENKTFEKFYLKYLDNRLNVYNTIKNRIENAKNESGDFYLDDDDYVWNLFYKRLYILKSTSEQKNLYLHTP